MGPQKGHRFCRCWAAKPGLPEPRSWGRGPEHDVTWEGSGWGRTSAGRVQTRRCGGKAVWCWDGRHTVGGHELCSCWRGQQKRSKRSVTTRRTCYASRSTRVDLPGDRTMPTSFCPGSPSWLPLHALPEQKAGLRRTRLMMHLSQKEACVSLKSKCKAKGPKGNSFTRGSEVRT